MQEHGHELMSMMAGGASSEDVVPVQDEDHLYLVMEYLAGGDVMVRFLPVALRWSFTMSPHALECCDISC